MKSFILAVIAGLAQSKITGMSTCPKFGKDFKIIQELDRDRYAGFWYEIYHDTAVLNEQCTNTVYEIIPNQRPTVLAPSPADNTTAPAIPVSEVPTATVNATDVNATTANASADGSSTLIGTDANKTADNSTETAAEPVKPPLKTNNFEVSIRHRGYSRWFH